MVCRRYYTAAAPGAGGDKVAVMAATTTFFREDPADAYPTAPAGLSAAALALWPVAWDRLESYIVHRWTPRVATWIAEGPGCWRPSLWGADVTGCEVWTGEAWLSLDLDSAPAGGIILPTEDAFRITATVGADAGDVPPVVLEAARRLAEFMAAPIGAPGATSETMEAGSVRISRSRSEYYRARSLQSSGAADLLRDYRRA